MPFLAYVSSTMEVKDYLLYVSEHGCIFHRFREAVLHHFPQKRVRTDADWKVIPLCNECHTAGQPNMHRHEWEFLRDKGDKIVLYFTKLLPKTPPNKALAEDIIRTWGEDFNTFWEDKNNIFGRLYALIVEGE